MSSSKELYAGLDSHSQLHVVVNDEDQYSLLPEGVRAPTGWHVALGACTPEECRGFIQSAWVDSRPRSVRTSDAPTSGDESLAWDGWIPVHAMFDSQARRRKTRTAVVVEDYTVSWEDLQDWVGRVRALLQSEGIGRGSNVVVFMARSAELVAAALGVLSAGAVLVPMNPHDPIARIKQRIKDISPSVILTDLEFSNLAEEFGFVTFELCPGKLPESGSVSPVFGVYPDDIAAIVFTSGSTGRSKGVMLTHKSLSAAVIDTYRTCDSIAHIACTILKSNIGYMPFFAELLPPLAAGAHLVVAKGCGTVWPRQLTSLIQAHAITHLNVTPSYLNALMDSGELAQCRSLQWVDCSGETLPLSIAKKFFDNSRAKLTESYGCSEAAGVLTRVCSPDHDGLFDMAQTNHGSFILVLNEKHQPVEPGQVGRVFIGGPRLARGYWRDPYLTSAAFVPQPRDDKGSRIYRSGDLIRVAQDGRLEFVGRTDLQMNAGGLRANFMEIECAVTEHNAVSQAVVVEVENGARHLLVACVELKLGRELSKQSLRQFLYEYLPIALIPNRVVFVESLPLTATGKLDRKAVYELVG